MIGSEAYESYTLLEKPSIVGRIFQLRNFWLVTFMVLSAVNLVQEKELSQRMPNYPYVLTLTQPLFTTSIFASAAVIKFWIRERNPNAFRGNDYALPIWKFALAGLGFSLTNSLLFTGSRGTLIPGSLFVILKQAVIPVTMILAYFVRRSRYGPLNAVGALLVVSAIVVSVWPDIKTNDMSYNSIWAIALVLIAAVPYSLVVLLIESALQDKKIEVFFMWAWINLFEIVAAIPLILYLLPIQGIPLKDSWKNLVDGYDCLFEQIDKGGSGSCEGSLWWFLAFIAIIILLKVNQAVVIQQNNATLMWLASASAIPLADFLFAIEWLGGDKITWYIGVGAVLVWAGLILYRVAPPRNPHLRLDTPGDPLN